MKCTQVVSTAPLQRIFANGRAPLIWGVLWGVIQAAAPLGFWWLDAATVYGMSIALIATVYIGFAYSLLTVRELPWFFFLSIHLLVGLKL